MQLLTVVVITLVFATTAFAPIVPGFSDKLADLCLSSKKSEVIEESAEERTILDNYGKKFTVAGNTPFSRIALDCAFSSGVHFVIAVKFQETKSARILHLTNRGTYCTQGILPDHFGFRKKVEFGPTSIDQQKVNIQVAKALDFFANQVWENLKADVQSTTYTKTLVGVGKANVRYKGGKFEPYVIVTGILQ